MPTQEERLTALERVMTEYRPVLRDIAYELTIVKGLITDQIGTSRELREHAEKTDHRLERIETTLDSHTDRLERMETLLTQILARLPEKP